jgi:hypothetical protein
LEMGGRHRGILKKTHAKTAKGAKGKMQASVAASLSAAPVSRSWRKDFNSAGDQTREMRGFGGRRPAYANFSYHY